MPQYSSSSERNLGQCDVVLQGLLRDFIVFFDHSVITGHRTEEEQNQKVEQGLSQVRWPNSKHNTMPSIAVDIAPYDKRFGTLFGHRAQIVEIARWLKAHGHKGSRDERKQAANMFIREQYTLQAGLLISMGMQRNAILRWGGDWNRNFDTLDNSFDDLGHFELVR